MKTAEEFFREKIKNLQPNKAVIILLSELITGEQALRWAQEYATQQAIEFAKWISEKASSTREYDMWLDEKLYEKSTEELYELFKNEQK